MLRGCQVKRVWFDISVHIVLNLKCVNQYCKTKCNASIATMFSSSLLIRIATDTI